MENLGWSDYHLQDPIWWNKKVRLKSKKFFFFYPVWDEKGFRHISDLFLGHMVKTFEDLVIEYDIPIRDRRQYNYLMNGIYLTPRISMIMFLIKFLLLLWVKRRSQNIIIPF